MSWQVSSFAATEVARVLGIFGGGGAFGRCNIAVRSHPVERLHLTCVGRPSVRRNPSNAITSLQRINDLYYDRVLQQRLNNLLTWDPRLRRRPSRQYCEPRSRPGVDPVRTAPHPRTLPKSSPTQTTLASV